MLLAILLPVPALAAPPVIVSGAPDKVAVTLYRDPDRGVDDAIDRSSPSAFALIAETRTIDLPPGEVTVRFEGVAGGIVPQSAILFGTSPRERNRDAALLSQKGLVDGFTGQQVILKRTDPATGKVTEERATVRSAANRLVLTTPRGVEAVYCSGLMQTLIYPGVPAGLSAKPVLSMTTKDQPGGRITITLAYIATGFDWDATYIGTLSDDGKSMRLLSWLTMASGDETSFVDATTAAVAGRINRSVDTRDDTGRRIRQEASWLNKSSQCWPAGTTTDGLDRVPPGSNLRDQFAVPAPMSMAIMEDAVVSRGRMEMKAGAVNLAVQATQEALGDLKLYRIPVPVTVAARSQKQVAFLFKERVQGQLVYRARMSGDEPDSPELLFRFKNRKQDGLGEPLPSGKAAFFQQGPAGRMLIGESSIADKAVDEEVEMVLHQANDVTFESTDDSGEKLTQHTITIRNANPYPARVEIEFPTAGSYVFSGVPGGMMAKPGKRVWAVTLPANGTRVLKYGASARDGD